MRGNKFKLIFYLKIPGVNREEDRRAIYLLTTVNLPRDIAGRRCRRLFKWSLRCEGR